MESLADDDTLEFIEEINLSQIEAMNAELEAYYQASLDEGNPQ